MEDFFRDADAVDFDAVGAAEILEEPMAVAEGQLAVQTRDVGLTHADIARLAAADGENRTDERNGITAADWDEFSVGYETHKATHLLPGSALSVERIVYRRGQDGTTTLVILHRLFLLRGEKSPLS